MAGRIAAAMILGVAIAGPALADGSLMAPRGSLFSARAPMFDMTDDTPSEPVARAHVASLFADTAARGLFAPLPERGTAMPGAGAARAALHHGDDGTPVARIFRIIASAEAGKLGYDAVQHGARVRTPRAPTQMTLQEIYDWIAATPGQPHAIGRYQFIPKTLKHLVRRAGVDTRARFSPEMQDRLAHLLLQDAGLDAVREGLLSRHGFMNNLAKIWAGLPNSTGRSHYDGYAGNKATMSWASFDAQMAAIFPG